MCSVGHQKASAEGPLGPRTTSNEIDPARPFSAERGICAGCPRADKLEFKLYMSIQSEDKMGVSKANETVNPILRMLVVFLRQAQ